MPWGRLDDSLYDHPKLDELGSQRLPAIGLWTLCISWSNRYLTDGHVPGGRIVGLGGTKALAERLVSAGLFEVVDGGFQIHDFLEFNDSREEVIARRATDREKKRRQRQLGSVSAGREVDNGRYSPRESPEDTHRDTHRDAPVESPRGVRKESPATRPDPSESRTESRAPESEPVARDVRKPTEKNGAEDVRLTRAQLDAWATFGPEWEPFKAAWLARGFRHPPAGSPDNDDTSQRGLLWQIASNRPNDLGRWVAAAPGKTARQVIEWVLAQWHEVRAEAGVEEDWFDEKGPTKTEAAEALTSIVARMAAGSST